MKKVIKEDFRNGSILGGNNIKELFKGDVDDFNGFIEDLECDLAGETSISNDRDIPFGSGSNFTIHSDEADIYVYYYYEVKYIDGEEQRVYFFGKYE